MGLGGYLAWTAVAREIVQSGKAKKLLPCEVHGGQYLKIVESEIWKNNPYISLDYQEYQSGHALPLQLNNPRTNYCKNDTPTRAFHRFDKHIIGQICEFYGLENPLLKCELFFSEAEHDNVGRIMSGLDKDFITIEPESKTNYTSNRVYPFDKWQKIVNSLSKKIQVVQIGRKGSKPLKNTTRLLGDTSFREAALLIGRSKMFLSSEGGLTHAATTTDTPALVILTGYQHEKMVAYPQNINIDISSHGPCGLKRLCPNCEQDSNSHDWNEIVDVAEEKLCL